MRHTREMSDLFGGLTVVYEKTFPTFITVNRTTQWLTVEFMNDEKGRVEIELDKDGAGDIIDRFYDNKTKYDITVTIRPRD
jgi:hypothetical protein